LTELPLILILLLTSAVSVKAFDKSSGWLQQLMFHAVSIRTKKQYYRFFTYGLVHADFIHLFVNMYVLWTFGGLISREFFLLHASSGNLLFLLLYFGALPASTIPAYFTHKFHSSYCAVGASGAVSAVVFACIIINPQMSMGLMFLPFFIPAWLFGLLYLLYSFYMTRKGNENIGHDAHLFGALFGILFILISEPQALIRFLHNIKP